MPRLLIDVDTIVYRGAVVNEVAVDAYFEKDAPPLLDLPNAIAYVDKALEEIFERLGSVNAILLATSPVNFRRLLNQNYKANRTAPKPALLPKLYRHLKEHYDLRCYYGLEADDLAGILYQPGDVLVHIDKDLDQHPGDHYNPNNEERYTVTPEQAAELTLIQTLAGDSTDGYKGCPGIGPKKAAKALSGLQGPEAWSMVESVFKSAKKPLEPEIALMNYWMARLLRPGEYHRASRTVFLHEPSEDVYIEFQVP